MDLIGCAQITNKNTARFSTTGKDERIIHHDRLVSPSRQKQMEPVDKTSCSEFRKYVCVHSDRSSVKSSQVKASFSRVLYTKTKYTSNKKYTLKSSRLASFSGMYQNKIKSTVEYRDIQLISDHSGGGGGWLGVGAGGEGPQSSSLSLPDSLSWRSFPVETGGQVMRRRRCHFSPSAAEVKFF